MQNLLARNIYLLLLAAATASTASSQLIVDVGGSGTHRDLQAAVDAARDGMTIEVRNGDWSRVVIRNKSVTLIASSAAVFRHNRSINYVIVPCLEIQGTGRETVRLSGIRMAPTQTPACDVQRIDPAVVARQIRRLEIYDSVIYANVPILSFAHDMLGASGLSSTAEVVVVDSTIEASKHTNLDRNRATPQLDGAAGLVAPRAFLLRSRIVAGSVRFARIMSECPPRLPNANYPLKGGDAVRAVEVHSWDSILIPGRGATVEGWCGLGLEARGTQGPGRRVGRAGTLIEYPSRLFSTKIEVGRDMTECCG